MRQHTLVWIVRRVRRRIPAIMLMVLAQAGHAVLGVWFALGSRGVIDSAVAGEPKQFAQACAVQGMIIAGILVCLTLMRHMRERLDAELERDWKKRLLHGVLCGEYSAVSSYHSAELINRLNNDVRKVNDGVLTLLPGVAALVIRLIAAVAVLGALDPVFTAVAAGAGCVVLAATALVRRRLKALNKQVSEHDGRVSGYLQESVEKLLLVQAMDVSAEVEKRADTLLDARYRVQRKRKNVSLAANFCVSVMRYGAGFLALWWCASKLLRGEMSFGSLTAVIQLVNQLQAPFVNLSGALPKYVAMLASAERLMELESIPTEQTAADTDLCEQYDAMRWICAEGLSFSYDRDEILKHAEFVIPKNAFVAVTGPSGTGKSTLLKLMLGIFKPESGRLYMEGTQGEVHLDRSSRRMFAYVPQGNLLFSGTLRENLTLVREDATEKELQEAVYVSAMEDYLSELPQGLETVLGENGSGLSEGQAQRLAIARAVLSKAPIVLLDECTSALDEATEEKVLTRLKELPERTIVAVTHRSAAVRCCDLRLEVSDGKVLAADEMK